MNNETVTLNRKTHIDDSNDYFNLQVYKVIR